MEIVLGDITLGVIDREKKYIFSYQTCGLESFVKDGREWIFRAPKPTFWRPTTCNDRGNGFSLSSSEWLGADMFISTKEIFVELNGDRFDLKSITSPANTLLINSSYRHSSSVKICYIYQTATRPSADVAVTYTLEQGKMGVDFEYRGVKGLSELPVCGMRFIFPFLASSFDYIGLSGETYPDRKCGAKRGDYHIDGLPLTPYLVPQECGMHMDSEYLRINYGRDELIVRKRGEKDFNFSLLPYSAEEIENAYHHEELPPKRRTYLVIAAQVRGVGGINSWGAQPEERYHLFSDRNYTFSVEIE